MVDEISHVALNTEQASGNPEWGYRLSFAPGPQAILHEFCGENRIPGAVCPHCQKPLLRLLSLDAKDAVLNIDPAKIPAVHLLYCWTCSIPYDEFCYKINGDGSVSLLRVPQRDAEKEFGPEGPYDGYTGVFLSRQVALEPIASDEQEHFKERWNSGNVDEFEEDHDIEGHQVGGYPFIYNPSKTICPECGVDMPLLAAICDDATGNASFDVEEIDSFAGNGGVQMIFNFCRECAILSAYHSCD